MPQLQSFFSVFTQAARSWEEAEGRYRPGWAVVKWVGEDIQDIKKVLQEAGLELKYENSSSAITSIYFEVEANHPWFNHLVSFRYDWDKVSVSILHIKYVKANSLHYPPGFYSAKALAQGINVLSGNLHDKFFGVE